MKLNFSEEVSGALHFDRPVVALESTVIAHGLPFPQNIETAYKLERIIRENGATPATIAIFDGEICVGLNDAQIESLATATDVRKVSVRDLPLVIAGKRPFIKIITLYEPDEDLWRDFKVRRQQSAG